MLKENQKALLRWNGRNTKRYISLGYNYTKQGDEFEVDVKDLSHASKAKVVVICDYCGKEVIKHIRYIMHNMTILWEIAVRTVNL